MNVFSAMEIISSSLTAQRTRLNLVASNLANAQTTRTEEGGPYRRKDPVFESEPIQNRFQELLGDRLAKEAQGVRVKDIVVDQTEPQRVYDPGHPDADASGFVAYPNVNVTEEMVNMIMASRAYDAGATAMKAMGRVGRSALNIGG
ncbi:MAG: flagellar basal body rod protein FlgC [Deltaproteobacteria bacterium]|nr:flagellar basal body rod protein FlgC [Deltaproteobacteria bacterium]MBN2673713.1 flagellar basal body rod protein FlgC [Deltaproteobacteria bacterium]